MKIFKTVLIPFVSLMCFNITNVKAETKNINVAEVGKNLTKISWHNNASSLTNNNEETISLFNKYDIDLNEASNSLDVYIQEEYIEFDEVYNQNNINAVDLYDSQAEKHLHNKGYINFTTKAYALGFYDGSIVYHIVITPEQQKSFVINQKDNLIIRHGDNAVTLNIDNYQAKGESCTPCTFTKLIILIILLKKM